MRYQSQPTRIFLQRDAGVPMVGCTLAPLRLRLVPFISLRVGLNTSVLGVLDIWNLKEPSDVWIIRLVVCTPIFRGLNGMFHAR